MTLAVAMAVLGLSALVALHRLRSRPQPRSVATLLFWRQDASAVSARSLGGRFRHRRTFALLCSIVVLASLALAAADFQARDGVGDVLVIDAGLSMAAVDPAGRSRFDLAVRNARADLDRCRAPAVILAGSTPVLLSPGGEPAAVVSRRLDGAQRPAGASAAGPALELAASLQGHRPGRILWYTSQSAVPDGLPPTIRDRIELRPVPAAPAVAVVAARFVRGDSDGGSLRVALAGESDVPTVVEMKRPDAPPDERAVATVHGRSEVTFAGVPAAGQVVEVRVGRRPNVAAARALAVQLPDDRPLTLRFDSAVPSTLEAGLLAFGVRSAAGAITVTTAATTLPASVRAAVVVLDDEPSVRAMRLPLSIEPPFADGLRLEGAASAAAPGPRLPGRAVVSAGGVPVISLDESAACRTVYVRAGVLSPDADLPRRAAFPLLLRRLCERLVSKTPAAVVVSASRSALDPLWRPTPAATVAVAADPPAADSPAADPPAAGPVRPAASVLPPSPAGRSWVDLLLPLTLALLVFESLLHAARKIV